MVEGSIRSIYRSIKESADLLNDLISADTMESMFRIVQDFLFKFVKFDAFLGAIANWRTEMITFEYVANIPKKIVYRKEEIPINEKDTLSGWVIKNGKTLYISDTNRKEELPSNLKLVGEPMCSWIGVPMIFRDEVIGLISVQGIEPSMFTADDLYFIKSLTDLVTPVFKVKIVNRELDFVKQLDELVEQALSPIGVIQNRKLVFVNRQFGEFLGVKKYEILGKDFLFIFHPDEREKILKNYEMRMRDVYVPEEYMTRFIDKEGKTRWGMVRAKKTTWNGEDADVFTIMDVTGLKKYAEALESMERYIRQLRKSDDENEIYEIFMNAIQDIFDVSEIFIGVINDNTVQVIKKRGYKNLPDKILLSNTKELEIAIREKCKKYHGHNGDSKKEYIVPVQVDGKTWGVVGMRSKKGVTERDMIRALINHLSISIKLLKVQRNLEYSRSIQELMVRMVTHDLQNVIAVIAGYNELLKEEYNQEYLREIEKALKKAEEIIDRTRVFSKLDIYRVKENLKEVDIRNIIKDAFKTVKSVYKNAIITIHGNAKILGYTLLKDAFENLLGNAYKYGATKVDVYIENLEDKVRIRIADNGVGIPEEKRDKIFEEFIRLDYTVSGEGIGLWIVKKIVELHNGRIWIEENKPKGSVFVIEIPTR